MRVFKTIYGIKTKDVCNMDIYPKPKKVKKINLTNCIICGIEITLRGGSKYCIDHKFMTQKQKRKLTEFEKKWGEVCFICNKRKGTFLADSSAEGGVNSTCQCDSKK